MNEIKENTARILSSIHGSSYKVEELRGGTLHYTNHCTLSNAVNYCRDNGVIVIEIL